MHFQCLLSFAETIKAKEVFEVFVTRHSAHIQKYHNYNGDFVDQAVICHYKVNRHHNSIVVSMNQLSC